jgi:hypothetical protein
MVFILNYYILWWKEFVIQQKLSKTQGQKVLSVQWTHKGRKGMKKAQECLQRGDI